MVIHRRRSFRRCHFGNGSPPFSSRRKSFISLGPDFLRQGFCGLAISGLKERAEFAPFLVESCTTSVMGRIISYIAKSPFPPDVDTRRLNE